MTAINKISVKGFRNIESVEIDLQKNNIIVGSK